MINVAKVCTAGVAAALLMAAVPAMAQGYGYYEAEDGPPAPRYAPSVAGPYAEDPGYGAGRYYAHQETYVGPYGYAHRRCRPHRACYENY